MELRAALRTVESARRGLEQIARVAELEVAEAEQRLRDAEAAYQRALHPLMHVAAARQTEGTDDSVQIQP